MEWATVTVSGASATYNGTPLELNGVYTKTGTENGAPKFTKSQNGNTFEIVKSSFAGWTIQYLNNILYYHTSGSENPWSSTWQINRGAANTTFGGNPPTVTLTSPDCLRFEGSEYLTFTNPLTGNSAELFAVIQPDALAIGETSGPVIGNIGGPNLETFVGADGIVGFAPQLFRGNSSGPMHTYATTPQHSSWHLFSISSQSLAEGDYYRVRRNSAMTLNYYSVWSRNTFNNEGPFIGRSTQGAGAYFKGRIAEILLYNRALTLGERSVVQTYLNNKYSLWT